MADDAKLARLEQFIANLQAVSQDVPAELYESFNDLLGPACALRALLQQDEPDFAAEAFAELDALLTEAGFPPERAEANRTRRDRLAAQCPPDFFPGGRQRRRWWGLLVRWRSELRRALEGLRPGGAAQPDAIGGGAGKPAGGAEAVGESSTASKPLARRAEAAYRAHEYAERTVGRTLTDKESHAWLKDNGPAKYDVPADAETFARYARAARKHYGANRNSPRAGRTGRSIVFVGDVQSRVDDRDE